MTSFAYVTSLINERPLEIIQVAEELHDQTYQRKMTRDLSLVPVLHNRRGAGHSPDQLTIWKVGLVSAVVDVDEVTQQSSSNILICHLNENGVITSLTTERCIFYQGKWKRFSEEPAAV